jgi:hypothetical protein
MCIGRAMAMRDDEKDGQAFDLDAYAGDASLTEGQKRRLDLFRAVEGGVCSRIEAMCERTGLDVTDVAVLVIGKAAPDVLFRVGGERFINVIMGHRTRLYAWLSSLLPPPEAEVDPYGDLLEPAPVQCVRVLIIDEGAITVMSYGSFITVRMDPTKRMVA